MSINILIFLISLLPLLFSFQYALEISLLILTVLMFFILFEIFYFKKGPKYYINSYSLFIFSWIAYALMTNIWVIDNDSWSEAIKILLLALGYGISTPYLLKNNFNNFEKIIMFLYISTGIHLFIALFEIVTGTYLFTSNVTNMGINIAQQYPLSFFYNTNDLATFLLYGFIIIINIDSTILSSKYFHNIVRSTRLLLIILTFIVVYFSQSRLILLSMLVSMLIKIYSKLNKTVLKLINTGITLGLIGVMVYGVSGGFTSILSWISDDASGSVRITLSRRALEIAESTDYLGVGAGNVEKYINDIRFGQDGSASIHNFWIENLANYGLIVFLFLVISYIHQLFESFNNLLHTENSYTRIAFTSILLFLPASISTSSLMDDIWIWFMIPLILTLNHINSNIRIESISK